MGYRGSCQCGAITAVIAGEPVAVRQCWCRQCQQLAAGGPTNNAIFRVEDVELAGTPATHAYVAASGNTLTQSFCARCGTPVMAQSSARPHLRTVRLGFLDAGHGLRPDAAIWTDDAPAGVLIDPAMARFDRQPPPPPSS